jgi:hypothetical protein
LLALDFRILPYALRQRYIQLDITTWFRIMTLQIFRDPFQGQVAGAKVSRRENLALGSLFDRASLPGPAFTSKATAQSDAADALVASLRRRAKIWELGASLHCSIIGTCLTTADLRHLLTKMNVAGIDAMTEHDLHKLGVALAGQRDGSAKLLQKLLDRKHQRSVDRFETAASEEALAALWQEASAAGDIPGAYWATLSHGFATEKLIKRIFGEVHMLSHIMGSANRADIRRLADLEAENTALRAKLERQQGQIHDMARARDAKIADLTRLLAERPIPMSTSGDRMDDGAVAITLLERRLSSESSRRASLEEKLAQLTQALTRERTQRNEAAQQLELLRAELAIVEDGLSASEQNAEQTTCWGGQKILYIGGMTGHVAGLREIAGRFGAELLHHDGGLEDRSAQLAGLIAQAGHVFFPVDCISHDAMHGLKRLCRQAAKRYQPLRSAGLTTFLAALRAARSVEVDAAF